MNGSRFFVAVALVFIVVLKAKAQSIPVGLNRLDSYYRDIQIEDTLAGHSSYMVRPIYLEPGSSVPSLNKSFLALYHTKKTNLIILPAELQTQFNSHHPYGWNDGSMIPAKGLQSMLSGGVYFSSGLFSFQFRPEIVTAVNSPFETFNQQHFDVIFARYYDIYNNTDLPVRFGTGTYTRVYWGQSSIRLNYKAASIGISSENLWWGPGIRNSLLMSNTAPGFKHITLNTRRPVQTPVGTFEGQFIAGRLEGSGFSPLEPDRNYFGIPLFVPKNSDWRYLSGFIITWSPKWVPGLFLGMAKTAQSYSKDLGGLNTYIPFSPSNNTTKTGVLAKRDELGSVFLRWQWLQSHAEVYFEYGVQNNTNSVNNSLLEPQDARAYIFGLRKALDFNKNKREILLISLEATQMQETSEKKIGEGTEWYVNPYVRHGYTNRGEVLGAGIGPGANLQTLDVSWMRGLKKAGLQFERYLHNDDFYYYAYSDSQDFRRHWVDLSVAAHLDWNFGHILLNTKLTAVQSLNYQWFLKQFPDDPYFVNGKSAFNIQLQTGLVYRF